MEQAPAAPLRRALWLAVSLLCQPLVGSRLPWILVANGPSVSAKRNKKAGKTSQALPVKAVCHKRNAQLALQDLGYENCRVAQGIREKKR